MKWIKVVPAALFCVILLSTEAFSETYNYYLPYYTSITGYWTGVAFRNCDSTKSAMVDVYAYDNDGNNVSVESKVIPADGQVVYVAAGNLNKQGWIKVNSSTTLVGLCFFGASGSNNYMADISLIHELSTLLYVPHVAQSSLWDTSIMLCNPNSSTNVVTLSFVNQSGTVTYSKDYSIPANGSRQCELNELVQYTSHEAGSVEISSDRGVAAFALYRNLKTGNYSYAGISAVALPDVSVTSGNIDNDGDGFTENQGVLAEAFSETYTYYLPNYTSITGYWTGVAFRNCDSTKSAMVDVYAYDNDGNNVSVESKVVPADGQVVYVAAGNLNKQGWIKVNSSTTLVGLCFFGASGSNNYMADISLIHELSTLLYVPHVAQSSLWDTSIMLCNPNSSINVVTLSFVNQSGTVTYSKGYSIPANGSRQCELNELVQYTSHDAGSVEISSDKGVAAFALYRNLKTGNYSYAGISAVAPPDVSVISGNIDNDGDGYTENQGDCNDGDNEIHPGATEVCGDGIDQDCNGHDEVCEPEISYAFEDFNNGSEGFFEYDSFSFLNDRYAFRGDGSAYYSFFSWNGGNNPSLNWYPQPGYSNYFDDFNVSVITHWDSGSPDYPYGLSACIRKNSNGGADSIEFDIDKNGHYAIFKATNDSYEALVGRTPSFLPNIDGQANKLAIEKENNSFRFFINDVEVKQLVIDGFPGGGLAVGSTGRVDVSFDDFKVTEPFEGQLVIPSTGYLEKLKELVYKVMTTTYLWYDTVPAVDLSTYSSAEALLDDLRYKELDKWSYITPKEEYHNLMEEGKYIGLGFGTKYKDNNDLRIKFVYRDSPAAAAGLSRGDKLIEINGKTIEEIETNGLWGTAFGDDEVGTPVTLKIVDHTGVTRTLNLEKDMVTINTVLFNDVLNVDNKKIGYLVYNEFLQTSPEELDPIFTAFKQENVDELILDLRYNHGGSVYIAQHLSELIAGGHVEGGVFTELIHNDKYSAWDTTFDFSTTILNSIDMDRVVIITTGESCSASELLINSLRPFIDVDIVGDTTCGKPVGMHGYDLFDMHISPIEFKSINADGNGEYYNGIEPTCHSEDDLTKQFGDTQENSLMKALNYVKNGSCTSGALASGIMKVKGHRKEVPLSGFRREIGAF